MILLSQITIPNRFDLTLTGEEYQFYLTIELYLDDITENIGKSIFDIDY